jgi:hypothetical protein
MITGLQAYKTTGDALSRKASKACSINKELLHEHVWVREAKLKLEAAREKTLKSNCKRKSKVLGIKKRNMQRRSSLEVSCKDREDKGDDVDLINAADGVKGAVDSVVAKELILKGKRRKALKQKAKVEEPVPVWVMIWIVEILLYLIFQSPKLVS